MDFFAIFVAFILWLAFAVGVAVLASSRGRSVAGWFFVALMCSPLLGAIALLAMPDLEQQLANTQIEIAQIERQQEFQRSQAAEQYRQAQAEAARVQAEQARITGSELALALEKLRQLHEKGLLTEVEYIARKRKNLDDLMDRTIVGAPEDFLAELLPLIDADGLTPEDIVKVKAIVLGAPAAAPGLVAPVSGTLGPYSAPAVSPPTLPAPLAAPPAVLHPAASTPMQPAGVTRAHIPRSALAVRRPMGIALVIFAVPLGLIVLHWLTLGSAGITPLALLLAVGAVLAAVISLSPVTRDMTSRALWQRMVRKRALLYAAVGVIAAAEVPAIFLGLSQRRWRRNFDAALANADPCAVLAVTNTERATEQQLERRGEREQECREQRAHAVKEARHKRCLDGAGTLAAGNPVDRELLQGFGDTAGRMLSRKLTPADLADTGKAKMPCAGFPDAVAAFYLAYAKVAVQVPSAWADATASSAVDQDLRSLLEDHTVALSSETDKAFASLVTGIATTAARTGKTSGDMDEAHGLCKLQKAIGATESDACAYLDACYQAVKKAEDAKAAREKRITDAKAAMEQRVADAKEKRQQAIDDAHGNRFRRCGDACEARYPDFYDDFYDRCMKKCCSGGAGCGDAL